MEASHPPPIDPGASQPGIFGQEITPDEAQIRILPVPFEATCSYGTGTAWGPSAILSASSQLDLDDADFGTVYEMGIHLDLVPPEIPDLNEAARSNVLRVITDGADRTASEIARVDDLSRRRTEIVEEWTLARLAEGKVPGILGGDHSCPLGAIRALANAGPLSILHIDAHLDLRVAYQGFRESHASIMHNVLEQCPGVLRIAQVGVRDYCEAETDRVHSEQERVKVFGMREWSRRLFEGHTFQVLVHEMLACLAQRVYVSFDIDGLDPTLCPRTGTPVPGGLSFQQAAYLLLSLGDSGRTVVGFDLCEVAGTPTGSADSPSAEFDANVGARVLYKLCGLVAGTRPAKHRS